MAIDSVHLYYDKNLSHAVPLCFADGNGKHPSYGLMDRRIDKVNCEDCLALIEALNKSKDATP